MADVITCPSGLQGRVRGMKVREERVLADRKLAKSGGQVDELLAACWEETLDPGPYALAEGAKLDLGKVLQGDRFFALLMVRALTYGPEYAFGVSCRNDNCPAFLPYEVRANWALGPGGTCELVPGSRRAAGFAGRSIAIPSCRRFYRTRYVRTGPLGRLFYRTRYMRIGPWVPAGPSDRRLGYCPLTMRGLTSICLSLVLLGCGSDAAGRSDESRAPEQPRLRLEVGGAFVTLPNGTVPVERALEQRILASYRLTGAADDPEVEIRRTPDGALVVLHHLTAPLVAHGGENAGSFLDELLVEQLAASGIAPDDPRVTPRQRNGAVQRCFSRATQASRTLASCTSAYIDADGTEVVLDTVRCESEGAVATCQQIVDSFASDRAKLPLERTLEATRSPGLPDVGPHGLAWIRLGATRAEFEDACRRSPGRIDTSESATAPPEVQRAMSAGRFVACAGGGATSLGPIELVHASFDAEDRLVQASLWVSASHAELSATLRRAYPDYLPEPTLTSYFVNRQATDDALLGITCSPSTSRPGRTMLQVTSRRGYDAPPF